MTWDHADSWEQSPGWSSKFWAGGGGKGKYGGKSYDRPYGKGYGKDFGKPGGKNNGGTSVHIHLAEAAPHRGAAAPTQSLAPESGAWHTTRAHLHAAPQHNWQDTSGSLASTIAAALSHSCALVASTASSAVANVIGKAIGTGFESLAGGAKQPAAPAPDAPAATSAPAPAAKRRPRAPSQTAWPNS